MGWVVDSMGAPSSCGISVCRACVSMLSGAVGLVSGPAYISRVVTKDGLTRQNCSNCVYC